jgi:DNA-binding LacI/PurR family transcriptional regulator
MDVTGHTSGAQATGPDDDRAAAAELEAVPHPRPGGGPGGLSRPVSIRDVAAAADVSYQTVSRVINNHPSVRPSTRDRVQAVITDLRFRPNQAARTLAGGPVHAVTALASNTTLYGYAAILRGIEEAARAAGFAVGIRVLESDKPAEIADAVDRATEPGTALIVIAYDRAGTKALAAIPPGIPVAAAVETPLAGEAEAEPWVWVDDREAARAATRYLLGLGHRAVHYVTIPSSTHTSPRLAGWRSALTEAGIPVPELAEGGWGPKAGHRAGAKLAADPDVTAVLCGNDDLAIGVIRAMHEAGRPVPGSVSVVGFDDIPSAAFLAPALTTVRLDFAGLGRACFGLLHSLLEPDAAHPAGPVLEPELIVRESAGPPPRSGSPASGR